VKSLPNVDEVIPQLAELIRSTQKLRIVLEKLENVKKEFETEKRAIGLTLIDFTQSWNKLLEETKANHKTETDLNKQGIMENMIQYGETFKSVCTSLYRNYIKTKYKPEFDGIPNSDGKMIGGLIETIKETKNFISQLEDLINLQQKEQAELEASALSELRYDETMREAAKVDKNVERRDRTNRSTISRSLNRDSVGGESKMFPVETEYDSEEEEPKSDKTSMDKPVPTTEDLRTRATDLENFLKQERKVDIEKLKQERIKTAKMVQKLMPRCEQIILNLHEILTDLGFGEIKVLIVGGYAVKKYDWKTKEGLYRTGDIDVVVFYTKELPDFVGNMYKKVIPYIENFATDKLTSENEKLLVPYPSWAAEGSGGVAKPRHTIPLRIEAVLDDQRIPLIDITFKKVDVLPVEDEDKDTGLKYLRANDIKRILYENTNIERLKKGFEEKEINITDLKVISWMEQIDAIATTEERLSPARIESKSGGRRKRKRTRRKYRKKRTKRKKRKRTRKRY